MAASPRLVVAFLLLSAVAWSQPKDAEALFNQGLDAMEAGKSDEACPAIAESQRLDPRPGTLFTLAECESKRGKSALAFAHYREYLRQYESLPEAQRTKQAPRKKISEDALAALKGKIGRVTLTGATAGSEILIDGQKVEPANEVPLEPGAHRLSVRRQGSEQGNDFSLQPGEARSLSVEGPASAAPTSTTPPPASSPRAATSPTPFYAAAGVGAVGLLLGTVGGVVALSKKGTISDECAGVVCSRKGMDAVDSGRSWATASTVGFTLGILGAGAAAGLWFSGVSRPGQSGKLQATPVVASNLAGWVVQGAW